jgi:uncharacterized protein YlxP (DUF503 family)
MTIKLLSYCSNIYLNRYASFKQEAETSQLFTSIQIYTEDTLDASFVKKYEDIFTGKYDPPTHRAKGGGFWIWKPYIISCELNKLKDGDILVYADIGCTISGNNKQQARFREYIEIAKEHDILFFELTSLKEKQYTTKKLIEDIEKIFPTLDVNTDQRCATILVINNNSKTRNLFKQIETFIDEDPLIITDSYDKCYEQDSSFVGHRHDQSIISLFSKGHNIGYAIPDETYSPEFLDLIPIRATRRKI